MYKTSHRFAVVVLSIALCLFVYYIGVSDEDHSDEPPSDDIYHHLREAKDIDASVLHTHPAQTHSHGDFTEHTHAALTHGPHTDGNEGHYIYVQTAGLHHDELDHESSIDPNQPGWGPGSGDHWHKTFWHTHSDDTSHGYGRRHRHDDYGHRDHDDDDDADDDDADEDTDEDTDEDEEDDDDPDPALIAHREAPDAHHSDHTATETHEHGVTGPHTHGTFAAHSHGGYRHDAHSEPPPPPDNDNDDDTHDPAPPPPPDPEFVAHQALLWEHEPHDATGAHTHPAVTHTHNTFNRHIHSGFSHTHPIVEKTTQTVEKTTQTVETPTQTALAEHTQFLPTHTDHDAKDSHAHADVTHTHDDFAEHTHAGYSHTHTLVAAPTPTEIPTQTATETSTETTPVRAVATPTTPTTPNVQPLQLPIVTEYMLYDFAYGQRNLPQWIELYNPNDTALQLTSYLFSYASYNARKGVFEIKEHELTRLATGEPFVLPAKGAVLLATRYIPNGPFTSSVPEAQVYSLGIDNYLKVGWRLVNTDGTVIHEIGTLFGAMSEPHLPKRLGRPRQTFTVAVSEAPEDALFYGLPSDIGTPGFHQPPPPAAPTQQKRIQKTRWADLKVEVQ